MITREYYKTREDGVRLFRTYSDTNHKIMQKPTMVVYDEAIDVEGAAYEYEETDELVEPMVADEPSGIMPQD
jgi:hypothetical protein